MTGVPVTRALAAFALRMPKVELHVHLEGSVRPATLLALAERRGVALPAADSAGLAEWFHFRDFEHFVEIYLTISRCLVEPEDFQLVAGDFIAEQARQNVVYTEAHFTISTHLAHGADGGEVAEALAETISEGERRHGVHLRLIPDIVRNVGLEAADATLEWALAHRGRGVVALGLAGIEARFGAEPFAGHFARAEAEGLHRVAHAGEHAGPEAVRDVLEVCHAERVGHGVRAIEDSGLVADLAWRGVPLEICPTSNVCLGVYPDLASHPFAALRAAGVRVSLSSDDPPLFDTTLTDEFVRTAAVTGDRPAELAGLSLAALRHSFLGTEEKAAWEREFRSQFAELGEELFGVPVEPILPPGEG